MRSAYGREERIYLGYGALAALLCGPHHADRVEVWNFLMTRYGGIGLIALQRCC
jgi:hypothetical protein